VPDPTPTPDDSGGEVVVGLGELAGLALNRERLDVSLSEVEEAVGSEMLVAGQTSDCQLGISEGQGLAVITDGKSAVLGFVLEREDARTREGVSVGDSLADIRDVYGTDRVAVFPDIPSQTGGPIVVVEDLERLGSTPGPDTIHYGFDTAADGSVTRIRTGYWPWVSYTDYCSPNALNPQRTGWPLTRTR
jgi:hypothetical protein